MLRPLLDLEFVVECDSAYPLKAREAADLIQSVFRSESRTQPAKLTLLLTTPQASRGANLALRGKDAPTNILSSDYGKVYLEDGREASMFELICCVEVIEEESRRYEVPLRDYWLHLLTHGAFHLLGYDHQSPEEERLMQTKERLTLERLHIPYLWSEEAQSSS